MRMRDIAPKDIEAAVTWAKAKGEITGDEVEALKLTMGSRADELAPALAKAGVKVKAKTRASMRDKARALAAQAKARR
jgi:predicted alpha/beta hydrolase